jgi:hypothetical protein
MFDHLPRGNGAAPAANCSCDWLVLPNVLSFALIQLGEFGPNLKKQSGETGESPMLFVSRLIAVTMLSVSISLASAAPYFEAEAICRTAIATIMGRDPKNMQVVRTVGDILFLTYVRPMDNFVWTYRCRIEGNRVVWATEPGRWREDHKDEKVFFEVVGAGKQLRIIENHSDGSSTKQLFDRDTIQ